MDIVSVQESKIESTIKRGQTQELGRSHGFNSSDRTISRRHVSFSIPSYDINQETRLQFEVIGINPIYVCRDDKVEIFRRFERGEMQSGDVFCVSAKNPIWYTLREAVYVGESVAHDAVEAKLAESLESDLGVTEVEELHPEDIDFEDIDHAKEFGFLVMGHEFDCYPKNLVRRTKNWNWFLEEPADDSEDEENNKQKMKVRGTRKRSKRKENDDEDWTGESEDEIKLINQPRKVQKPKYMTRSKDHGKLGRDKHKSKTLNGKDDKSMNSEDMEDGNDEEDEDEDDQTLGGFIVNDENLEEQEEFGDEEEEEDELGDEFDEDED